MDLLRFTKDVFGQKLLIGVNWEYLWVPIAMGLVVILTHMVLRFFYKHE